MQQRLSDIISQAVAWPQQPYFNVKCLATEDPVAEANVSR